MQPNWPGESVCPSCLASSLLLLPRLPRSLFLGLAELWLLFPAAQLYLPLTGSHTPKAMGGLGCPQTSQQRPKQRKRAREWSALHWPTWGRLPSRREDLSGKHVGIFPTQPPTPFFFLLGLLVYGLCFGGQFEGPVGFGLSGGNGPASLPLLS